MADMEQFVAAAFSIQNLMNVAQESILGMMNNSNQLHHLTTEFNLLLSHINLQPNTNVVSVGDQEFIAIFENNPPDQNSETNEDLVFELSDESDYDDLVEDENESNDEYELIPLGQDSIIDVIDTWEKFQNSFGPDFLDRCQDFVQELEEELTNLRSNIRNLHRAAACFREAMDIVTDVFNASPLETEPILNNIEGLEEHASDIQEILVEMEKARNIFPNEEEENEENNEAADLEESRPFPDAWSQ